MYLRFVYCRLRPCLRAKASKKKQKSTQIFAYSTLFTQSINGSPIEESSLQVCKCEKILKYRQRSSNLLLGTVKLNVDVMKIDCNNSSLQVAADKKETSTYKHCNNNMHMHMHISKYW